jgi:uncharacterized protein YcnI
MLLSALVPAIVLLTAAPAWAHVTVAPDSAPKGASDVEITFRVPNEEAKATVTKLDVSIPTDPPLLGVLAQDVPGWTSAVVTTHLPKAIQTDDGPVADAVSEVSWTADASSGIPANDFATFEIIVGSLPDSGTQIAFPAIQTYSDGTVVKWIDPVTAGGPDAEHPTPVLKLTEGTGEGTAAVTPTTSAPSGVAASSASVSDAKDSADTAKTIGIIAIVFAVVALLAVAFSMFRKRPTGT